MSTLPVLPEVSPEQISQYLAAARETISDIKYCWLATRANDGGTNARAVRVHAGAPGSDEWTRRFVVRRGSRKVAEMRAAPRVTLAYQHDSGNAYVALGGEAFLLEDKAAMRELWSGDTDARFPPGFADEHMMAVRVDVDRIELHVRGVTYEPFGHGRFLIERDGTGGWRFVPP